MGIETAADRAVFLSAAGFGETVSYVQGVASPFSFVAIFDAAHFVVTGGDASVSSVAPVLTCRADDFVATAAGKPQRGDTATVAGGSYRVTEVQPDGTGMLQLIMEKLS